MHHIYTDGSYQRFLLLLHIHVRTKLFSSLCLKNSYLSICVYTKRTESNCERGKKDQEMGHGGVLRCMFILFCLLLGSDSSVAKKPPLKKANWEAKKPVHSHNRLFESSSSSSTFTTQLDNIPIINPTTPTTTPIVTPINPFPPTTTTPTNPFPPTTTTPTNPFPPTTTTPTNPFPPTTTTSPPPPPITTQPSSTSGGSWCIASPTASETALQVALDYACGYGGADCSALQPGAMCYNPNTLRDHASYAFNDYYQKNPVPNSCSFGGTAQLTNTDPSSGGCHFSTSRTTPSVSPPVNPTLTNPPPTPMITNPAPFTPNSPTIDGFDPSGGYGEPTASPNSAVSMSCNLLILLFTVTSLLTFLNRAE